MRTRERRVDDETALRNDLTALRVSRASGGEDRVKRFLRCLSAGTSATIRIENGFARCKRLEAPSQQTRSHFFLDFRSKEPYI
jgi:hypothetical protein